MRGIEIKSKRTGVPGWHSEAEEDALVGLAETITSHVPLIVELGGEYGRSASEFAYALHNMHDGRGWVYTIDTFTDIHPIVGNLLDAYTENLKECGLAQYVKPVQGSTVTQAHNWKLPIDLLFIDAGHTYLAVKSDIAAWVGFLKARGVVVFHDYAKTNDAHSTHLDVKRAVDEWYSQNHPDWERHDGPDSLVWFVKKTHVQQGTLPTGDSDRWVAANQQQEAVDLPRLIYVQNKDKERAERVLQAESEKPREVVKLSKLIQAKPDYNKLSYKELRKLADDRGIAAKKKNDIIEALEAQDKED